MTPKEFFEKAQLYRKYDADDFLITDKSSSLSGAMYGGIRPTLYDIATPAINFICPQCKSVQTYNVKKNQDNFSLQTLPKVFELIYICDSCKNNVKSFFLLLQNEIATKKDNKNKKEYVQKIQKIGQYPAWSISIEKEIESVLDENKKQIYQKGLINESQGYGIGAYAYYRRITEEVIDELLTSIIDLVESENKVLYFEALKQVKKTRVAQDKIDLVKDLLPESMKPGGMNPLGVLHGALSDGLHNLSDEDCLIKAESIREALLYLLSQVALLKKSSNKFTENMKKILEKKS